MYTGHCAKMNIRETLQSAFIERVGPFAKGVVRVSEVANYVLFKTGFNPSAVAIGRLLCTPPFHGVSYQFNTGGNRIRRAIVLDRRWLGAPGKDIWAYLTSDYNDPLCQ
jgi:hypothetical protein